MLDSIIDYMLSFVPGWDCHGLPIEQKALSELSTKQTDLTPLEIRQRARQCAMEAVKIQEAQFKSWSIMGDWENRYLTLHPDYEARQLRVFRDMLNRGK
jgi:isoleucyl-tRNA synthetase